MIAYRNEKCDNVRQIMDFYLNERLAREIKFSKIGKHLENCLSCQSEWQNRLKFKERIKAAVMRDVAALTAPQSLFDSIRRQVRESR